MYEPEIASYNVLLVWKNKRNISTIAIVLLLNYTHGTLRT